MGKLCSAVSVMIPTIYARLSVLYILQIAWLMWVLSLLQQDLLLLRREGIFARREILHEVLIALD
jgi:hypothetical protein